MMGKRQVSAHRSSQPRRGDYKNGNEVCLIKDRGHGKGDPLGVITELRSNYRKGGSHLKSWGEKNPYRGKNNYKDRRTGGQEDRTWQSLVSPYLPVQSRGAIESLRAKATPQNVTSFL